MYSRDSERRCEIARQPFWTGQLESDCVGFYTDFLESMNTPAQRGKLKMWAQENGMRCDFAKGDIGIYDFARDVTSLSRKAGYADAMLVCPNLWLSISLILTELRRPVSIDPLDFIGSVGLRRGLLFVDLRRHTGNVLFVKTVEDMNDEYILIAVPTCGDVVQSLWTYSYARD